MTRPRKLSNYGVHFITSPAGQALLAGQSLTTRDFARAIANYQRLERIHVGTLIGINADGFFGSTREGWRPEQPDAYDEPLLQIPWWQVDAALRAAEDPTTGELRYPDGAVPH